MGMEDYRVVLKPKSKTSLFPDDRTYSPRMQKGAGTQLHHLTAFEIGAALERMGFVRVAPANIVAGAHLAAPPQHEARYTSRQHFIPSDQDENSAVEYILEALLQWHGEGNEEKIADRLSVRFAVCQPEAATIHFFQMLKRMCDALPLVIAHEGRSYASDTFWEFCLRANDQIRHQKTLWRNLFLGDMEELPIAVDEAWGYFLTKHRDLQQNAETTMTSARMQSRAVNAEATMTPQRRKTASVKRDMPA